MINSNGMLKFQKKKEKKEKRKRKEEKSDLEILQDIKQKS